MEPSHVSQNINRDVSSNQAVTDIMRITAMNRRQTKAIHGQIQEKYE
jgi:hypothetical protein